MSSWPARPGPRISCATSTAGCWASKRSRAHPGLLVHDLDGWASRLRGAGAPVLFDDDFPGMRRFYSEDPHGNRLEFLEPLGDG
jgi:hypothetical protein